MPDTWRETGYQLQHGQKLAPPPPPPLTQQQFPYYSRQHQEYSAQHYVPALNIIDFDVDAPPATISRPTRPRRTSNARSAASTSSWSSMDRPSVPVIQVASRIEKSAFRAFMDSKSDALRNKLSLRNISSKTSSPSTDTRSFTSDLAISPTSTAREPYAGTFEFAASPVLSPSIRHAQRPADTGMSVTSAVASDEGTKFGEHLSSVKRWCGGGRLPQPWNKLRKVCSQMAPLFGVNGSMRPGPGIMGSHWRYPRPSWPRRSWRCSPCSFSSGAFFRPGGDRLHLLEHDLTRGLHWPTRL